MNPVRAYTISTQSVTVIIDGEPIIVDADSPNYAPLKAAILDKRWDDISKYLTVSQSVDAWSDGDFQLDGDVIKHNGKVLPEALGSRMLSMLHRGEEPGPLLRFFERLQRNPSFRSVEQLFTFLQHCNIPLAEDGCFYAYKGVTEDLMDCHSHSVDNTPGSKPTPIPRNEVSDDPRVPCHRGYHVGAVSYATTWGARTVICKVDPEHVVCVPYDASNMKMRVTEYEVVGLYGVPLPSTVLMAREVPVRRPEPEPEPEYEENDDVDENEEPEDVLGEDDEPELPGTEKTATPKAAAKPKVTKTALDETALFASFDKMGTEDLFVQSLACLRRYATNHLGIVGGGRISGGKVPLLTAIFKARR